MVLFKHRNLNNGFYKKLEKSNFNADYVFEAGGHILSYEVFDACVLVSLDVTFPDKNESSRVDAYFFTTDKMKSEFISLLYQAKAAYSGKTAHPFQKNGAPFRLKLSDAQLVN